MILEFCRCIESRTIISLFAWYWEVNQSRSRKHTFLICLFVTNWNHRCVPVRYLVEFCLQTSPSRRIFRLRINSEHFCTFWTVSWRCCIIFSKSLLVLIFNNFFYKYLTSYLNDNMITIENNYKIKILCFLITPFVP